jgi:4-amino-4-deoxy-L-arabinose transferase-like glycosyltransferase
MKRKIDHFSWILPAVVLLSRMVCSGPAYFADGPAHIRAILNHTYFIQPPFYWLLNRTAGLFPNPESGLLYLNWIFSAAGAMVFYWAAKELVSQRLARYGAAVYATVFFVWFSGGVHSSYASQLLFPPLCFFLLLKYRSTGRLPFLLGAAGAFSVGAGLRPSDGAFLLPFFVVFVWRIAPWRHIAYSFLLALALCLAWLVPTYGAYHQFSARSADGAIHRSSGEYFKSITTTVSPLHRGVGKESLANIARYCVPLLVAFWPLLGAVLVSARRWRDWTVRLLLLWIIPGSLFFVLIYIADATYLNYLSSAVILLALLALEGKRLATPLLAVCLASNSILFLLGAPIPSRSFAVDVFDAYCIKYTRYGIKHQWWPNLSDIVARGVAQPTPGR